MVRGSSKGERSSKLQMSSKGEGLKGFFPKGRRRQRSKSGTASLGSRLAIGSSRWQLERGASGWLAIGKNEKLCLVTKAQDLVQVQGIRFSVLAPVGY